MTIAAPADAGVADPAAIQAIQDACDRIPYEERHRHRYVDRPTHHRTESDKG
jgi:hypothetical protein